jgi:hypothetical protein
MRQRIRSLLWSMFGIGLVLFAASVTTLLIDRHVNAQQTTFNALPPGGFSLNSVEFISVSAPTIVGTSCFTSGTATTITNTGTAAAILTVGGTPANTCVITFPFPAAVGWIVMCTDITTNSTTVDKCKQTASTATTATIGMFSDVSVAAAPLAADKIVISAVAQ